MVISLTRTICRNHVYIIVREGFQDNYFTTQTPSIRGKPGMEERLKSGILDEVPYRIVQNVVTNRTADFYWEFSRGLALLYECPALPVSAVYARSTPDRIGRA